MCSVNLRTTCVFSTACRCCQIYSSLPATDVQFGSHISLYILASHLPCTQNENLSSAQASSNPRDENDALSHCHNLMDANYFQYTKSRPSNCQGRLFSICILQFLERSSNTSSCLKSTHLHFRCFSLFLHFLLFKF